MPARRKRVSKPRARKTKKADPIPKGLHTITPHLIVDGAAEAIAFYQRAFGAQELDRSYGPDGKRLMHAEVKIGNSRLMLVDEYPEWGVRGPKAMGGTPVTIHLYVHDVDSLFDRAIQAGCTVDMPLMDAFWGDRYAQVTDPYGHKWSLATHKEDLSPQEMAKRAETFFANAGGGGHPGT